jgi:hypothetical protein
MSYQPGDELTEEQSYCCDAPVTVSGLCSFCWEHA